MLNICLCGGQAGYPTSHAFDCPYPYYGNGPQSIEKWEKERKVKRENDSKFELRGTE